MFSNQPNDRNVQIAIRQGQIPVWAHPERVYWHFEWLKIRDALMGEIAIKRRSEYYLPKMEDMSPKEYRAYLDRAVFFNMTRSTVLKMVGKLMRRPPKLTAIPSAINQDSIARDGQSLLAFSRSVAMEEIAMGRVGVLLDRPKNADGKPYFAGYIAENIMDWAVEEVAGTLQLTRVVLREIREDKVIEFVQRQYFASYRKLVLEDSIDDYGRPVKIYRQYFYEANNANADINAEPTYVTTPDNHGVPFDFIPFQFFGAWTNQPDIETSPIYDIVNLNYSHYKSMAHLEHGRFFTGLPVYYVQTQNGDEKGEYTIGSSVVWEVAPGEKPGIIEFNGTGLKALEYACEQKEKMIESLGGKLIDDGKRTGRGQGEAEDGIANEQAVLLGISLCLDAGLTKLLQWMAAWSDVPAAQIKNIAFETSKAFIVDSAGAREFRAIQSLYMDGVIPLAVVYEYLLKAEVIPDWMSIDVFQNLLESPTSFPNQLDVEARLKGYPDSITMWGAENPQAALSAQFAMQQDVQKPQPKRPAPSATPDQPSKVPAVNN